MQPPEEGQLDPGSLDTLQGYQRHFLQLQQTSRQVQVLQSVCGNCRSCKAKKGKQACMILNQPGLRVMAALLSEDQVRQVAEEAFHQKLDLSTPPVITRTSSKKRPAASFSSLCSPKTICEWCQVPHQQPLVTCIECSGAYCLTCWSPLQPDRDLCPLCIHLEKVNKEADMMHESDGSGNAFIRSLSTASMPLYKIVALYLEPPENEIALNRLRPSCSIANVSFPSTKSVRKRQYIHWANGMQEKLRVIQETGKPFCVHCLQTPDDFPALRWWPKCTTCEFQVCHSCVSPSVRAFTLCKPCDMFLTFDNDPSSIHSLHVHYQKPYCLTCAVIPAWIICPQCYLPVCHLCTRPNQDETLGCKPCMSPSTDPTK